VDPRQHAIEASGWSGNEIKAIWPDGTELPDVGVSILKAVYEQTQGQVSKTSQIRLSYLDHIPLSSMMEEPRV